MSQDTTAKRKTVKGEPPTHRGLQMSELEAPNTHLQRSTKRCSRGFGRRGKWSIGAPGGAGTDDGCRFGAVSEFGRRIDADHLLGTCVAHRVALCQRASPNRPCVSFPLCAFFGGPSANHGILFIKSVAASLPHSRFSWFSCCFRVVHLVMQGKDAD